MKCAHCGQTIYWDFSTDRHRHTVSRSPYCDDDQGVATAESWKVRGRSSD